MRKNARTLFRKTEPPWTSSKRSWAISRTNTTSGGRFSRRRKFGPCGDPNRLRSFGVDLGATYRFAGDIQPSLTLAYAFGSGDPDPDDGTDRQFRQTGLQDNSHHFNGIEEFRYYGEALDPDLSNLHVLTVDAGIRPTKRSSIDLTYHVYGHDTAVSGEVPGARVSAKTTGESRNIGHGLNLILACYGFEDIRLRAKLGYFSPGNAFDARVEDASFIETGFEIRF